MNAEQFLLKLQSSRHYGGQVVHVEHLPARQARFAPIEPALSTRVGRLLEREGVKELYAHQARAIETVRAKKNVVVVTGTASGKTLCYNVPVMEELLFFAVIILFSIIESVARSRKKKAPFRSPSNPKSSCCRSVWAW